MKNSQPYPDLIRQKNFQNLWISQILSQLTINLVTFSILTEIYHQTRSSVAVSLLWLAFSVPIFLLGPLSGSLVDRFDLKKTMVITNILQGLVVLLLLFDLKNVFLMYSIVLIYSALDRFYVPAQGAAVPWLVSTDLLPTANGLFFLTQQASLLLGFGLGGIFLQFLGLSTTIISSALFLFFAAFAASNLPKSKLKISPNSLSGFKQFITDILDGYKVINSEALLRYPMGIIMFLQTFITVVAVLLPSFAYESLGISINNASLVLIVPASLGALVASFLLPKILKTHRKRKVIEVGLGIAGISLALISVVGLVPIGFRLIIAIVSSVGVGSSMASSMIPSNTLIQEYTPKDYSGRIFGVLGFLATVASLIPMMIIASMADIFGTTTIFMFMSLLLLVCLITVIRMPDHVLRSSTRL